MVSPAHFFSLFIMLLLGNAAWGDINYRYQHWDNPPSVSASSKWFTSESLPHITVLALTTDHEGMLWVGTENGLARFDGHQFEIFNSNNVKEITANWIEALYTDSDGNIWVSTYDSILVRKGHTFVRLHGSDAETHAQSFTQANNGVIWVGGKHLWTVDGDTLSLATELAVPVKRLLSANNTLWLLDKNNQLASYTNGQLQPFHAPAQDNAKGFNHRNIIDITAIKDSLFIASTSGVFVYDANQNLSPLPTAPEPIISIRPGNVDVLFGLSDSGNIYRFDNQQQWHKLNLPSTVPINSSRFAFMIQGDQVWLGTSTTGLHAFWPTPVTREAAAEDFGKAKIWSFFTDDGIFAASDLGIFKRENQDAWTRVVSPSEINQQVAYSYWRDEGLQLIGTRKGLYTKADASPEFSIIPQLADRQINTFFEHDNELLIGTSQGLFQFDIQSKQLTPIPELATFSVRSLFYDTHQQLWIGTDTGLFYRDTAGRLQPVPLPTSASVFVSGIRQTKSGEVLVATYGEGLFLQDNAKQWRHLTATEGVPFQHFYGLEIVANQVWLSGAYGVITFPMSMLTHAELAVSMLVRDDNSFPSRNRLRCCNGAGNNRIMTYADRIYVPTLEGVLSIDQQHIITKQGHPPVISAVLRNDQRITWNQTIRLNKESRDINIAFTMPNFTSENIPEFRYRLLPSQEQWVYPGTRRIAYFMNLPSGQSRFEVEARAVSNQWEKGPELVIDIAAKFEETILAKFLFVLFLLLIGTLAIRARTSQLRRRAEELEQLVTLRTTDYEQVNAQLIKRNEELKNAAVTDALTKLHNRRFMQEHVASLISRLNRRHYNGQLNEYTCAMLLLDIDHFKQVNDTLGHDKGDEVLKRVASALQNIIRNEDFLLRWGGEEFLLVAPEIKNDHIDVLHKKLHLALVPLQEELGLPRAVTVSVGIICLPWHEDDITPLTWQRSISLADLALYFAKKHGRNASVIVRPDLALGQWSDWSNEGLEQAMENKLFSLELWSLNA